MPADASPVELVEELHRRQGEMYAGGPFEPVLELLAPEIVWHVPGTSPIAGDHRGREGVRRYFDLRRRLAEGTMRMSPGALLCEGGAVAQFVRGTAMLKGEEASWQTLGVYRLEPGASRIDEVWLIPLDAELFDRIWTVGSKFLTKD